MNTQIGVDHEEGFGGTALVRRLNAGPWEGLEHSGLGKAEDHGHARRVLEFEHLRGSLRNSGPGSALSDGVVLFLLLVAAARQWVHHAVALGHGRRRQIRSESR
jgi:hypothetical protein